MGLGTTAAILGGVVGIGSSILGNKAQKKAAGQAADASAYAADRQFELGQQSLALNRDIYNANFGILSPFVSRGNVAGNQINALLGLPSAPAIASPLAGGGTAGGSTNPLQSEWDRIQGYRWDDIHENFNPAALSYVQTNASKLPSTYTGPSLAQIQGMRDDHTQENALIAMANAIASAAPAPTATNPAQDGRAARTGDAVNVNSEALARKAFDTFAKSAGMDFQMDLARNELNQLAGGNGWLQSGAAIKEATDRAQNMGISNYFLPYMGLLSGQQSVGAGAASSVAGVGQNFGNSQAAINNQIGNSIGNHATNVGNLALAQGQNQANMWANLGSSFGQGLGALSTMPRNTGTGGYDVNAFGGWS